jgi:Asp-tRNA(Asn)/Glu-tRNA(Gln) amidotransferase A subunit family amidase
MSNDALCLLSASGLLEAYRKREVSPVDVIRAVLDRIDRLNPRLNACLHVGHDGAMASITEPLEPAAGHDPCPSPGTVTEYR